MIVKIYQNNGFDYVYNIAHEVRLVTLNGIKYLTVISSDKRSKDTFDKFPIGHIDSFSVEE